MDNFTVSPQTDSELDRIPQQNGHVPADPGTAVMTASAVSFELGLWLAGLRCYLKVRNHAFPEGHKAKASAKNWASEARLIRSALLQCTRLALQLNAPQLKVDPDAPEEKNSAAVETGRRLEQKFSSEDLCELAAFLRNAVIVNETLLSSPEVTFQTWLSFSELVSEGL